jgi:hypothetical protein
MLQSQAVIAQGGNVSVPADFKLTPELFGVRVGCRVNHAAAAEAGEYVDEEGSDGWVSKREIRPARRGGGDAPARPRCAPGHVRDFARVIGHELVGA